MTSEGRSLGVSYPQSILLLSAVTRVALDPKGSPSLLPEDERAASYIEDELRLLESSPADDTAAVDRLIDFVWGPER